ncbi:hypothetical protein BJF86_01540 [Serinicoccus sp. CNJ-927]|uniref:hypothetical protein n=1 Tax=Serinicoccus sp. CNJ-927 TaxID=1904970 RepID=UPI000967B0BA|nr:hypothetical protein [Serinicoccus sp. CNJ-927]OLT43487.1 hypothetical protein BJF86_01540 [Serinicoccus sp. CNJ-927]
MSRFEEFNDVDPDTLLRIRGLLELTPADMGPELATFRATPGWRGTTLVVLAPAALLLLMPLAPDAIGRWLAVLAAGALLLATGAFWVRGWSEQHRVCRHGLVLGRRGEYAVPWSTLDPGRVRLIRRANFITRYGIRPGPLLRPGETLGHALLVNGVDATPAGQARLVMNERLHRESGGADADLTCFDRWFLAGRHAPDLLRAMEEAMVADGYSATGLTDAVLARPLVLRWAPEAHPSGIPGEWLSPLRRITDPVLGVDAL